MKKLILFFSAFMVVAAVAITVYVNAKSKMSPLMLANLEALTDDEAKAGDKGSGSCYYINVYSDVYQELLLSCSDCKYKYGISPPSSVGGCPEL